ncbi:MAG: DUF4399 domain-containing protein [Rhodobacteraceae bacterium]|nr:DUF4399 domain-containing protein [Paracoccaceae bacterium]
MFARCSRLSLSLAFAVAIAAPVTVAQAEGAPSPAGAQAYIISPADGATVSSPFTVQFGLKGMGIAPAGIDFPDTGHHHILIDHDEVNAGSDIMKTYMPTDDPTVLHFGKGQTETKLTLAPGSHTLQLVLGDLDHHPHNPPVYSPRITVTVK